MSPRRTRQRRSWNDLFLVCLYVDDRGVGRRDGDVDRPATRLTENMRSRGYALKLEDSDVDSGRRRCQTFVVCGQILVPSKKDPSVERAPTSG